MKKFTALAKICPVSLLIFAACGHGGSHRSKDTPVPTPSEIPAKVEPGQKEAFVAECEYSKKGGPYQVEYTNILEMKRLKDCSKAFDAIVKTRRVILSPSRGTSLAPLKHLTFCFDVTIGGKISGELAVLKKFKDMRTLGIDNSDISDITFAKSLPSLRALYVTGSPLADVSNIVDFVNLEHFDIRVPMDERGVLTLPKDEAHCPVNSANKVLNEACSNYRSTK